MCLVMQSAHEKGLKHCQKGELGLLRSLQQTSALIQLTGQYFWLLDTPLCIFILKVHNAQSLVSLCDILLPTTQCQLLSPSLLSSADSVPQAQSLQEREDVWFGLAGALLQEELH